jgi:tetratricopeptide (TPR) repeat protein
MSLLIKALANAAKDKQAQQAQWQAAQTGGALALAAMDTRPIAANPAESAAVASEQPELSFAEKSTFNTDSLSTSSKWQPNDPGLAAKVDLPYRALAADATESEPLSIAFESNAMRASGASTTDQSAAAKAFVKHIPAGNSKLALIGFALSGSVFLALAAQGYAYLRDLNASDRVQLRLMSALAVPTTTTAAALVTAPEMTPAPMPTGPVLAALADTIPNRHAIAGQEDTASRMGVTAQVGTVKASLNASSDAAAGISTASPMALTRPQSLVQLHSKKPLAAVDPALLAAYEAFNRGEDAAAQQQYRQLLQHDVRNVDALFGMAAIAQRQGRDADAVGWYQALLAIDPRNMGAQSALLNLQPTTDALATSSRIKSMLVQQPEAASLHAALGNLYAAQNQWTDAQHAYFNASQFAPDNADYAFNLAISLDQLGKSKLALQQYQRSLDLINSSAASSPDRAQLEARMQALQ